MQVARQAVSLGEIPVGAIAVINGEIIASAHNAPITNNDPSAHAEMIVLRAAAKKLGNYRIPDVTLYVTLEPCMMCAGAMLHARIQRLVFASTDYKTGVAGGCFDWLLHAKHNHRIQITRGVLDEECRALLRSYFRQKRES